MALILIIDTAIDKAIVCFCKDDVVLCSAINENQKDHAGFLETAIKKLALDNNIDLKNVNAIAVTDGPGSYTGLRVGMASAKGLCFALNKPLITISTLQALAVATIQTCTVFAQNPTAFICPMIDARRMEVFTAVYTKELQTIVNPAPLILTQESFNTLLQTQPIVFVGNGSHKVQNFAIANILLQDEISITPTALAYLAFQGFKNEVFANLAYAQPNYLKEFVDNALKKNI